MLMVPYPHANGTELHPCIRHPTKELRVTESICVLNLFVINIKAKIYSIQNYIDLFIFEYSYLLE